MNLLDHIHSLGKAARTASHVLATLTTAQKNEALWSMATQISFDKESILEANRKDIVAAQEKQIPEAMIDRLSLNYDRLNSVVESIRTAAALPDPVGRNLKSWKRENGLEFEKISVPIGVIGIIYESRPNVTSDAAILCLKAGNATLLRGGSEAFHSNQAITNSLQRGLAKVGLPAASIQLVSTTDREAIPILCEMNQYIDCMIPRGGKGLIETVMRHARMPVIKHYDGICAAFIDASANLTMAKNILLNAKCQRPSACNALETLLLHRECAIGFFETAGEALLEAGVELRCDEESLELIPTKIKEEFSLQLKKAREEDFNTEFLSLKLAVKIVHSLQEAITHIEIHGSHHSDLIITESKDHAEEFLQKVNSATIYWNASTRFTDGGEFGLGAEIGISTDKLHARGPMGLEELTSYKYLIRGVGQIRK
ncbi:MAG: glutamate-5-semialdehyde dehydrogenase [Chthoniobacterales bacterium]|nr:glutamate-5-semialdehyde dehydrogenase [Chthoniobacterales bacterium]